jgi:hypothetical protein
LATWGQFDEPFDLVAASLESDWPPADFEDDAPPPLQADADAPSLDWTPLRAASQRVRTAESDWRTVPCPRVAFRSNPSVIHEVQKNDAGVQISLNGGALAIESSVDLVAQLRKHKGEIIALLRQEPTLLTGEVTEQDGTPDTVRDAWARFQAQKPVGVSDADWRQAIDAAGRFLKEWGSRAVESQWAAGDLFDVTPDCHTGGLIWFLNGENVRSLGPEHAVTKSGRVFDRVTRGEWINPARHDMGSGSERGSQ